MDNINNKNERGFMTVATKLEIAVVDKICEQGLNSKRNIRLAEMVIRRQARRQNKLMGVK